MANGTLIVRNQHHLVCRCKALHGLLVAQRYTVVVPDHQMLSSLQATKIPCGGSAVAVRKITYDVHIICSCDPFIPQTDKSFIHFVHICKRTVVHAHL